MLRRLLSQMIFDIQWSDNCQCIQNVSVHLFDRLSFVIHPDKSASIPTQGMKYLGFIINSVTMTVTLTEGKSEEIDIRFLNSNKLTIRKVASLIGKLVSYLPATTYGTFYYRY